MADAPPPQKPPLGFTGARSGLALLAFSLFRALGDPKGSDAGVKLPEPLERAEYEALDQVQRTTLIGWIVATLDTVARDGTDQRNPVVTWTTIARGLPQAVLPDRFITWFLLWIPMDTTDASV